MNMKTQRKLTLVYNVGTNADIKNAVFEDAVAMAICIMEEAANKTNIRFHLVGRKLENTKIDETDECECCGESPVVGVRHAKQVDGGTELKVCRKCMDGEWDMCHDCDKDIDECECKNES